MTSQTPCKDAVTHSWRIAGAILKTQHISAACGYKWTCIAVDGMLMAFFKQCKKKNDSTVLYHQPFPCAAHGPDFRLKCILKCFHAGTWSVCIWAPAQIAMGRKSCYSSQLTVSFNLIDSKCCYWQLHAHYLFSTCEWISSVYFCTEFVSESL